MDTNLLVAALTNPRSATAGLIAAWRDGEFELIVSAETLGEAQHVLRASWVARVASDEARSALLDDVRRRSVRVTPERISSLRLRDVGDRWLVEAAVAGHADYLATSDREVLDLRGYETVRIGTGHDVAQALGVGQ